MTESEIRHPNIITLTTDFGTADTFVGQMKGSILTIAPDARIVDVTHEVPVHDMLAGAIALESVIDVFASGTIHVAVVDPGVGTPRHAIGIETDDYLWIGPDNGVFTAVLARCPLKRAVALTNADYHRAEVSATFHGRDIFAPAAAHLAKGVPLAELGDPIDDPVLLDLPKPQFDGDNLIAHVLCADRFGNLVTDLTADHFFSELGQGSEDQVHIQIGSIAIQGVRRTFGGVEPGEPVAYLGSGGRLEIAVRNGSAARQFGTSQVRLIFP